MITLLIKHLLSYKYLIKFIMIDETIKKIQSIYILFLT